VTSTAAPCRDTSGASDTVKRAIDIGVALLALLGLAPLMLLVAVAVKVTSRGPVIYWSKRVGRYNALFQMPKFRTMRTDTPDVATHLLSDARSRMTAIGPFLRRWSLDELPQLFSVLRGDMTLVGPRPALFNQDDLIALRTAKGVQVLTPGVTGWAQINGRDELPIPVKVEFDEYYLRHHSLAFDLAIMTKTFVKAIRHDGISH
jgi:O-antigen biosynthesis protein WbqP